MRKEESISGSNLDANHGQVVKKERHIVSWSREEDDILREQIQLHGSENWAIIASKFQDKTTRQCRRRWFTYLNSDFKKGGWSPEEDILLCEAQRIYGNRWTEIAKVVSGRTDNAVKNRFTTLCKKRAKIEGPVKVNSTTSYVNLNNKRVVFRNVINSDEGSGNAASLKKIRTCISSTAENQNQEEKYAEVSRMNEALTDKYKENELLRNFLDKDDPKVLTLMQQTELLGSLASKVDTEMTDQILGNAWTVLQDLLKQSKGQMSKLTNGDTDFQLEKMEEDESSRSSWRDVDVCEPSPAGSHYSTGSTNVACDKREESDPLDLAKSMPRNEGMKADNGAEIDNPNSEFNSPSQMTPLFRTLAAAIPTPRFSESEKHFLMKTLGLESTSPSPIKNPSQPPPPCKRSLLHCL